MLQFLGLEMPMLLMALSAVFTFGAVILALKLFKNKLPVDGGRDFAFNGKLSKGKQRGAGIVFICVFILSSLIFIKPSIELGMYYVLIFLGMLSGYLDDASKVPWGEYKKGAIDLAICLLTSGAFVWKNPDLLSVNLGFFDLKLHWAVFLAVSTVFLWMMINATNCSDGIDGFCGSLSVNSIIFIILTAVALGTGEEIKSLGAIMIFAIIAYLWYNAEPSTMMMGDAGSRAIGLFLGILVLKSGNILFAIPLCFILLLDGLIGIFKVSVTRFLKIKVLKNIRTPLHDHFRKNKNWSNTQTIYRLNIIQALISFVTLMLVKM
ncbi:MAG: phospho-N-acetylmuramoyl-pentapeptide-transferase [Clostridia bacterium]|nr:phospho-N-acetylmuramoyl-pentapeptide-transferase [Clostridia bacterium]